MKKYLPIAALLLASCANYSYTAKSDNEQPEAHKRDVKQYNNIESLKNAELIGVIQANAFKKKKTIRKAKRIAADNGANAIYVKSYVPRSGGGRFFNTMIWRSFKDKWQIEAYRTKETLTANK